MKTSFARFSFDFIDDSLSWIESRGRSNEESRERALKERFLRARKFYEGLEQ